jgi:hypothetical protein
MRRIVIALALWPGSMQFILQTFGNEHNQEPDSAIYFDDILISEFDSACAL